MLNKLLIAIFVVLLIIIVESAVFLVVMNNFSQKASQEKKNNLPFHPSTKTSSKAYKNLKFEPAIHPTMLKQLSKFMKSPNNDLGGLYILQEQTTKVIEIEAKGACVEDRRNGVLFEGTICFPFAMKLENKTLPEGYTWTYFTETNIKVTKVYIKSRSVKRPAQLKDIKPGDTITTIEKWDPSIPWDVVKLIEYLNKQMVELTIYINRDI